MPADREADDALIRRCLQGQQQAMEELVSRYHKLVFALCFRMVGNTHDAEDLTQETFVRVFRHLASWDPQRAFRPWLLAIAANRCRSFLGQRRHQLEFQPGQVEPLPRNSGEENNDLKEEVELGLHQLRAEHRQAFLLFYEQELSYAEIAEVMQCPVGTVKTWIHRARQELIRFLTTRGTLQAG